MGLSSEALAYYIGGAKPTTDNRSCFDELTHIKEAGVEKHPSEFANSLSNTYNILYGKSLFSN